MSSERKARWEHCGVYVSVGALVFAMLTQGAIVVYQLGRMSQRVDAIKETTDVLLKQALTRGATGELEK